jgi:hypothetical protein
MHTDKTANYVRRVTVKSNSYGRTIVINKKSALSNNWSFVGGFVYKKDEQGLCEWGVWGIPSGKEGIRRKIGRLSMINCVHLSHLSWWKPSDAPASLLEVSFVFPLTVISCKRCISGSSGARAYAMTPHIS